MVIFQVVNPQDTDNSLHAVRLIYTKRSTTAFGYYLTPTSVPGHDTPTGGQSTTS